MVEAAVPEHVSDVRHHGGHVAGRVGAKSIHLQRKKVKDGQSDTTQNIYL